MPKALDVTGEKYNLLTAIRFSHCENRNRMWVFICDCGTERILSVNAVRTGNTKSCGCLQFSQGGKSHTPEYDTWKNMLSRCYDPRNKKYHNYGGKGVRVCDRWRESFSNFLEDMGKKPTSKHSIDRRDSQKDYEPGNCHWGTWREQVNNRCTNVFITHNGETMTALEWSARIGLHVATIYRRVKSGLTDSSQILSLTRVPYGPLGYEWSKMKMRPKRPLKIPDNRFVEEVLAFTDANGPSTITEICQGINCNEFTFRKHLRKNPNGWSCTRINGVKKKDGRGYGKRKVYFRTPVKQEPAF